ncbi:hypothetical protein HBH56_226490 [Parastagonospora nodorum]|uniref:Chitin-binding type-1 domain-containing protein n=1 Tax=Phaeosphaeria nodorum (strain SN15 / ATCC MYA-4574 / FGSC 10173) TaxID=321614 RepID=A0A7U2I4Q7_PHANO|nr:hypothetical protein HBH56_226490 [Parastagonospora nodorum]QRD01790.1 hypothetical protein JI435_303340 [Parastagonospora nodorum SN15]KAH3935456.1 hypothetical protein HBH54_032230 [Parastagonospora nodorum]KAH3940088.1 hypothetical protein HBH53_224530 [Parastagonospora nodorum]KAH3988623.1 hypothetical protein HBH52_021390 [Parastagonospora nodorum]
MRSSISLAVAALLFLNVNALRVSTSSICGKQSWNTLTCKNSSWGNCCSKNGRCGSTPQHCGTGCQAKFGDCKSPVSSAPAVIVSSAPAASSKTLAVSSTILVVSSAVPAVSSAAPVLSSAAPTVSSKVPAASAAPVTGGKISTDGICGGTAGSTCVGSSFGNCCSAYGWCGSTAAFCATGCQAGFGKCDTPSPSPSPSTTCGVEGFANVEAYYASSFNLIDATDVSTCATLCLAEAECKSYLFNPKLGNCAYLMNSLEQGEFIATSGTDQLFWERACAETK